MNPQLKNVLPVFMLACEIGNVADFMGRTKGAGKYMKLVDLFDEINGVGGVAWAEVMNEFKAMDTAARAELLAEVKAKLDLPDDKVEAKIEEGLALMVELVGTVEKTIAFVKALKA